MRSDFRSPFQRRCSMPIFMFRCQAGHLEELFFQVRAQRKPPKASKCPECGRRSSRSFKDEMRTNVKPFKAYFDPGLGKVVHSAAQIDAEAAEAGLVVVGRVP